MKSCIVFPSSEDEQNVTMWYKEKLRKFNKVLVDKDEEIVQNLKEIGLPR